MVPLSLILILLFFRVFPLTVTVSLVILVLFSGEIIVTASPVVPVFPLSVAETVTVVSPVRLSSTISVTNIFCFQEDLKITPLLNFFSPLSSAVNWIDFHCIGTVSPNPFAIKIIDHR